MRKVIWLMLILSVFFTAGCGAGAYKRAMIAYQEGRPDEAKRLLIEANRKDEDNFEASFLLGSMYLDEGDTSRAITQLLNATRAVPKVEKYHLKLGEAYIHRGLLKNAITQLDFVLMGKPKNSVARNLLGFCHLKRSEYEKAYNEFKLVSEHDPNNAVAIANLAELAATAIKSPAEARIYYEKLLTLSPGAELEEEARYYLKNGELPLEEEKLAKETGTGKYAPMPSAGQANKLEDAVLVLPFIHEKSEDVDGGALAEYLRTEFFTQFHWTVVREADTKELLETLKLGDCRTAECLDFLAKKSTSGKVVTSEIRQLKNERLLMIKIYDATAGTVAQKITRPLKNDDSLFTALDNAVIVLKSQMSTQ